MSIELSYKDINNGLFQQGISKLGKCPAFKPTQAYNIARIAAKVEQETKQARELYFKMMKKYAKLDEKGAPIAVNTPPFFEFAEGASKEEFEKEHEELLSIQFKIERYPLEMETLPDSLGATPAEMLALEAIWAKPAVATDNVVPIKKGEGT